MKETLTYTDYERITQLLRGYIELLALFEYQKEFNKDIIKEVQEIIDKIIQGGYDLPY